MADEDVNYFDSLRKTDFSDTNGLKTCFDHFDKDRDGLLDANEFSALCKQLFVHNHSDGYHLTEQQEEALVELLDSDKDGKINMEEFEICWKYWFRQVLSPVSALVIVDVQNDFIDGSLALRNSPACQEGSEVLPVINKLLEEELFDVVVYTKDWHPADHISFFENVKERNIHPSSPIQGEDAKMFDTVKFAGPNDLVCEQTLWPTHCVQGTWGAELHQNLKIVDDAVVINKGTNPDIDSYSAFWDNMKQSQTSLVEELKARRVTDIYVCGLAVDICVAFTSLDGVEHGYRTVVIEDAVRGIDCDGIKTRKKKMKDAGCVFVKSADVPDMLNCKDRHPELGYQAAVNVAMAMKIHEARLLGSP
ncbi:uncharacterized protein [Ptychodera flava]|uniref:uncharacterized protein n=1 Tax=Ptychodera flava TaxID=63121 RepID=UPI003969CBAC